MSRISPTVRGLAIVVLVAAVITALQLQLALAVVFTILRIVFLVAIAIFLFILWRRHREEISMWQARSRAVFYGAVALALVNTLAWIARIWPRSGLEVLVFFFVFAACIFAMWRAWRDEHTYGY